MSIPTSIRSFSFTSKLTSKSTISPFSFKPFFSFLPHSLTFFKPISFQQIPTIKPLCISPSSSPSSLEQLPDKLQEIVKLFQSVEDPRAKYQQLMFYANNLSPLDDKYKINDNKVVGCVSQVWVRAYLDHDINNDKDYKVYYEADSDSIMTKGLAALLVKGLSGQSVSDILRVSPDFVTLLGLQQNLTPSRNNGFLNMLKLMQRKALFLGLEAEKGKNSGDSVLKDGGGSVCGEEDLSFDVGGSQNVEKGSDSERKEEVDVGRIENDGRGLSLGRRGERIKELLERELRPVELVIEDVSYQHAGHAGVRGSEGETHFNLKIVADVFEGKSLVKRHRMIYGLLQDELQSGLHALSITAKTPSEA